MLPIELTVGFWEEVMQILMQEYHLPSDRAQEGIVDYRVRLELHGVGEMVYHRNARDVAQTIARAIQQGGFKTLEGKQVS